MKTCLLIYLTMISFLPMLIFLTLMNLYYYKVLSNPIKQMIFLIMYSIMMSFCSYLYINSYLYSMFILIVYISGVMILFSYFISMLNMMIKKIFKKFFIPTIIFMLMYMIYYMSSHINNKLINNNMMYPKFMKIYYLYFNPNMIFMFLLIMFLMILLYLSFKICFLKKKPLRKL